MKFPLKWLATPALGGGLVLAAFFAARSGPATQAADRWWSGLAAARPSSPVAVSAKGDGLEAGGTLEGTLVRVSSKLQGKVTEVLAREGDRVSRGQALVRLEDTEAASAIEAARAKLAAVTAKYEEARAGAQPEAVRGAEAEVKRAIAAQGGTAAAVRNLEQQLELSTELKQAVDAAEAQVSTAEASLRAAEAKLDRVKAGARPEEVREAESAIQAAQATADRAAAEEDRLHRAFDRGAVARRDWDLARTEKDVAAANLARARARLADLKAGARGEEVREAESAVQAARASLAGARTALENARQLRTDRLPTLGRLEAARAEHRAAGEAVAAARAHLDLLRAGTRAEVLRALQAQIEEARAALRLAESRRGDLEIRAPVTGRVAARSVEPGEVVLPGARLLELSDPGALWVRVYLRETEYGRVSVGERVTVTADSLPDRTFDGRVRSLAREAEFTPRNVRTRDERANLMYGIRVDLVGETRDLLIGMPVDVRFPAAGK